MSPKAEEPAVYPSVTGGLWGIYGWAWWPSYSHWLVPGTLPPELQD
jgi:hypothetical protein